MGTRIGTKEARAITDPRANIDLQLEDRSSATRELRAAVDRVARNCRLTDADRFALQVAATEAVTNALKAGDPPVEVTIGCEGRSVDIEVQNSTVFSSTGRGSKPTREFESGRGIPIMIALVDEIEFAQTRAGTRVRMRKRVHPEGESSHYD
ncbi:MAG TPA: ATP-binding protein [Gaiellaceae bacterium]|nr:ATP-binding protein [Gaiellaceae bacterium]